MIIIKYDQLRLGDVVRLVNHLDEEIGGLAFIDAIVKDIKIEQLGMSKAYHVTFCRPYMAYCAEHGPHLQVEELTSVVHSGHRYKLMRRE